MKYFIKVRQITVFCFLVSVVGLSYAEVDQGAADSREVIVVTAAEKAALLSEMRNFLIASQKILQASLIEDMQAVEDAARPVGMKLLKQTPEAIKQKLPDGFTAIGPKAHRGFEEIADEASGLGDREEVLQKLADLQLLCTQCHAIYRFEVQP